MCTGLRLKAEDGAAVYGRSMEWGSFDHHSILVVIARDFASLPKFQTT